MEFKYQCRLCIVLPFISEGAAREHMWHSHRISHARYGELFDTLVAKIPIPPTPEDILRQIVVAGDGPRDRDALHYRQNTLGDMTLYEAARAVLEHEESGS